MTDDPLNNILMILVGFNYMKTEKTYIVNKGDVTKFITAFIKLHHTPGINPYNNEQTAKLSFLSIRKPQVAGYWWTSPNLTDRNTIKCADFDIGEERIIYADSRIMADKMKRLNESQYYESFECCNEEEIEEKKMTKKTIIKVGSFVDREYEQMIDVSRDDETEVEIYDV